MYSHTVNQLGNVNFSLSQLQCHVTLWSHVAHIPHTYVFVGVSSYRMNDRFFPVLLHPSSGPDTLGVCCPVCEGKHSREKSPSRYIRYSVIQRRTLGISQWLTCALILNFRVSVPHSALQASSKVRPHRRRSFDPTDSMGLAKVTHTYMCTSTSTMHNYYSAKIIVKINASVRLRIIHVHVIPYYTIRSFFFLLSV